MVWRPFRKHCPGQGCPAPHNEHGQIHGEIEALQTDAPQELLIQIGRFTEGASTKNRAPVDLPPWLFPVPGRRGLFYLKTIVVHEGTRIDGGHGGERDAQGGGAGALGAGGDGGARAGARDGGARADARGA